MWLFICTRGLWNKKEHAHHALRKQGTRKNKTNHKTKPPRCTRQHIFSRGGRGAQLRGRRPPDTGANNFEPMTRKSPKCLGRTPTRAGSLRAS